MGASGWLCVSGWLSSSEGARGEGGSHGVLKLTHRRQRPPLGAPASFLFVSDGFCLGVGIAIVMDPPGNSVGTVVTIADSYIAGNRGASTLGPLLAP